MPWETFSAKGRPAQGHTPQVGVHAHGRIALNQAAYQALGQPSHVELLYDRDGRRVGLRAVSPETPHAYPVTKPDGAGRYVIVAVAFSRHYGISGKRGDVFEATLEDGILAASLPPAERAAPSHDHEEEGLGPGVATHGDGPA